MEHRWQVIEVGGVAWTHTSAPGVMSLMTYGHLIHAM